jgi:hypothetical protein
MASYGVEETKKRSPLIQYFMYTLDELIEVIDKKFRAQKSSSGAFEILRRTIGSGTCFCTRQKGAFFVEGNVDLQVFNLGGDIHL